jgi:hypothetical protein
MDKKYILVLDCETAGDVEKDPTVYDLGAKIVDLYGDAVERASWVIADVFLDKPDLMESAYYAKKLPQYYEDIDAGRRKLIKLATAKKIIWNWMYKYNAFDVAAYNCSFDRRALNFTTRLLSNGEDKYFFPRKTRFIDIWRLACESVCSTRDYQRVAYDNGWYSPAGNVRTTAEYVYRYLMNEPTFEESHTALEDVEIEVEIMLHCWKKIPMDNRDITPNPWRIPQKVWNYNEAKFDGII